MPVEMYTWYITNNIAVEKNHKKRSENILPEQNTLHGAKMGSPEQGLEPWTVRLKA